MAGHNGVAFIISIYTFKFIICFLNTLAKQ